jgi:hypothetical protein
MTPHGAPNAVNIGKPGTAHGAVKIGNASLQCQHNIWAHSPSGPTPSPCSASLLRPL